MNDSAPPRACDDELQPIVTVTETSSTNSASTDGSRQSSLMHFITEPMTHLRERKRKWASGRQSGSAEELTSSSTVGPGDSDETPSTDTPTASTSHWSSIRRKPSAATERVVGKIKTMFRKDSHFDNSVLLENAAKVHRDMHLENNIPGLPVIVGPHCCAYVHAYFDVMGEAGPSDFYETAEWRRFQRRQLFLRNLALKDAALQEEALQCATRSRQQQPLQIANMTGQQPRSNGIQIAMSRPEGPQGVAGETMHSSSICEGSSPQLPCGTIQRPNEPHEFSPASPTFQMLSRSPGTVEVDSDMD